jgi:hypothetical protein
MFPFGMTDSGQEAVCFVHHESPIKPLAPVVSRKNAQEALGI